VSAHRSVVEQLAEGGFGALGNVAGSRGGGIVADKLNQAALARDLRLDRQGGG